MACKYTTTLKTIILFGAFALLYVAVYADITTGLVAYYPFKGNANDESTNSNNGTVNGAVLTADKDGAANSAYSFNSNSYINCGNDTSLQIAGNGAEVTMSAWFKTSDASAHQYIISKGRDYTSNCGYHIDITGGKARTLIRLSDETTAWVQSTTSIQNDTWYHVAGTYDGNKVKIYINGVLENSIDNSGVIGAASTPLYIGCHLLSWYRFNGKIDEVRVFTRALSPIDVQELYNGGTGDYTVTYDANGATSGTAPSSQTKTSGEDLTLASNTGNLAKTDYTFSGWNTATDGSGTSYAEGATYSTDANLTLYAKWVSSTTSYSLTVTYGTGDGSYEPGDVVNISADTASGMTFDQWTGDTTYVADINSADTTVTMPAANVSVTATYTFDPSTAEKVTLGSVITINASEVEGASTFTKRPKIYAAVNGKKAAMKVLTKVSNSTGSKDSVEACWTKKICLYDKKTFKNGYKAGTPFKDFTGQDSYLQLPIHVAHKESGDKADVQLNTGYLLVPPEITSVEDQNGSAIAGSVSTEDIIVVKGNYFGNKAPKVWLEYPSGDQIKAARCKVLKPYAYADVKNNAGRSCMDKTTGASEITVQMPKNWKKGWQAGEHYLVIDNKIGMDAVAITTSGAGTTNSITGTVSGDVAEGVYLTLGGVSSATAQADASGNYSFTGLSDGDYTVTPTLYGYTFTPDYQSVTISGANQSGIDFTSKDVDASTYTISGTIKGTEGTVMSGVSVALSGDATPSPVTTGVDGTYSFSGLNNGNYKVTPTLTGYNFAPTKRDISIYGEDESGVDFVGVDVPAANTAPTANEIRENTFINSPITIDVIENCFDPDADPLTVTGTSGEVGGTTAITDNQVVFTPTSIGQGQFTYTVSDGLATASAVCYVYVSDEVNKTTGTVGTSGGTVTLGTASLTIPPGATNGDVTVTIIQGVDVDGNDVFEFYVDGYIDGFVHVSVPDTDAAQVADNRKVIQLDSPKTSKATGLFNYEWETYLGAQLNLTIKKTAWPDKKIHGRAPKNEYDVDTNPTSGKIKIQHACNQKYALLEGNTASSSVSGKIPVLFIHGYQVNRKDEEIFGGGQEYWGDFGSMLQSLYSDKIALFEFRWRTNQRFQDAAAELKTAIDTINTATGQDVHIIAHSFGGLLARTYLQGLATGDAYDCHAASLVTVGTPHSGIADKDKGSGTYLSSLPKGQDHWFFEGGGQISVHQAGENVDNFAKWASPYGTKTEPGYIIYKLSDTDNYKFPANDFPILCLIGLTTGRGTSSGVDSGDALITYEGQRFVPSLVFNNNNVALNTTIYGCSLTEQILGSTKGTTVTPIDSNPWTGDDSNGYGHSESSLILHFWPNGVSDYPRNEVHLDSATDSLTHATWLNTVSWLDPYFSNTPPNASFTTDKTSGEAPLTIAFNATGSNDPDGTIQSWSWNFGDGNTGTGETTSHTYTAEDTYTATLKVTDNDGATDTATVSITVGGGGGGAGEYLIVDLTNGTNTTSASAPSDLLDNPVYKTTKLVLRKITAGTFTMGSPTSENGRDPNNETQHQVTLTQDFYIGIFEITQAQYIAMSGFETNPSLMFGDKNPVESVSWNTIRGGIWPGTQGTPGSGTWLAALNSLTGLTFDLPTEAQWEYACRAGTTKAYNDYTKNGGAGSDCLNNADGEDTNLNPLGRYKYNCPLNALSGEVGSYQKNYWGLYDMHGNVGEFCLDRFGFYNGDETDPQGALNGSDRVSRGGSWSDIPSSCRSAYRSSYEQSGIIGNRGFRVILLAE